MVTQEKPVEKALTGQIKHVPLDQIDANPYQPRTVFDADELEKLSISLKTVGLQEPVVVRAKGDRFELIMGERRTRAARLAGWTTIPALVRGMDDAESAVAAIVENDTRHDMDDVDTARSYKAAIDAGSTAEYLAQSTGRRQEEIEKLVLMVERCIDNVLHLVRRGYMKAALAAIVAKLTPDGQQRFVMEFKNGMTHIESIGMIESIYAQENQLEMFTETKITPEARQNGNRFKGAVERATRSLDQLETSADLAVALQGELDPVIEMARALAKRWNDLHAELRRQRGQLKGGGTTAYQEGPGTVIQTQDGLKRKRQRATAEATA